ncbi:MAG: D-alanyl-D-alanine carboxypeptidase, partial [Clostridia bacterium]|nr:D-alanyl-D-alanine carboxypeptidase [Clostridia bacterium]
EFIDSDKQITLYNHNRLLREYEGCIGVKTGFTKKSGRCLVSAAKRGDVTLVAVTLNAGDDWNDHRKMLDYGFSCVDSEKIDAEMSSVMIPVVGSEIVSVRVSSISADIPYIKNEENSFTKEIFLEKFLYAPVNAGDIVGYVRFYNNGRFIKQMSLTAAEAADASVKEKINLWDRIIGFFDRW